ncbi:MAG TPA: hypothetical protein VGX96_10620 [Candidatus Elarobacter sp.]|nr:hypothetical protein [Candidatus Elarobacter sp.]
MDAPHTRSAAAGSVLNRIVVALCAAVAVFAGTVVPAQAQTAPAADTPPVVAPVQPAAAPADQTAPAPQSKPATTSGTSADAPKTVGQTPGAPPARPAPPPLGHWPIIDFVVTFTQPAYYGNHNALPVTTLSPVNMYDPVDVGGTVRIPVTRKLNLLFDRITEGTVNQPLECVLQPAAPGGAAGRVCANDSRDIILQYHATYAFDRFLTMDVGDSFRHRIWTNGTSGVSTVPYLCNNNGRSTGTNCTVSSTEHHFGYLGFTYTTKPVRNWWNSVFALNMTLDRQNVDHHVGMVCSAPLIAALTRAGAASQLTCPNGNGNVGYYDENPRQGTYYESTQGVTWILPVDIRHGTTFSVNERWGALNFYENPTINPPFGTVVGMPYRWTSANAMTLSKRFSPGFTLALRHQDYHSVPQGAPFVTPNAIHVGSWDVLGTFHLDTNSWFH